MVCSSHRGGELISQSELVIVGIQTDGHKGSCGLMGEVMISGTSQGIRYKLGSILF